MNDKWENLVLHELADEELSNLTDDEINEIKDYYDEHDLPEISTVKGLMKKFALKYDDLSDYVLGLDVGICNHAVRRENQIIINRPNSEFDDEIRIELDENTGRSKVRLKKGNDEYKITENEPKRQGFETNDSIYYILKHLLNEEEEKEYREELKRRDSKKYEEYLEYEKLMDEAEKEYETLEKEVFFDD